MEAMPADRLWDLRITRRCLRDDLGVRDDESGNAEAHVDVHPLVRAFVERRGQRPTGQESFRCGTEVTGLPLFTLHSGKDRGATWHQESVPPGVTSDYELGIVWLLGIRSEHDYDALCRLGESLRPSRADAQAFIDDQALTFARALVEEVPALLVRAEQNKGEIVEAVIAGRIRVRLHRDPDDDAPLLTVAISSNPLPATAQLAKNWLARLLSAFFPDDFADLSFADDIGGQPLDGDESAYCSFPMG